jgi:hypothetical protein
MENLRELVRNNGDLANYLLTNAFNKLSYDDKVFIKQLDRPTPSLNSLVNTNKNSSNRKFNSSWFGKCHWLTGSEIKSKLFCWPCLLFNDSKLKSPWCTTGVDNLKALHQSVERHGKSKDHTYAALKLKLFGKQNIENSLDSAHRTFILEYNEKVKSNREILKRLIDMTIFLGTQELAFRGHNEKEDSSNRGNYRELAEFLSSYDPKFEEFLKSSSVFSGMSKTIQNELIESVNYYITRQIESEIQNSVCFSWQIDETTDLSCRSQLSVVFRYTYVGEIKERFLGFFDVSAGRTADQLFSFLTGKFEKFNLQKKLVAQTYDGAAVMSGELNGLQSKIKSTAPQALFIYCYAHRLNLVLQDAVGEIQEVKIFFATLSGISVFFSKSTKRTNVLNRICSRKIPGNSQTRWNFKSRIVSTVLKYRDELLEVFNEISTSAEFAKDSKTIRESIGYLNFLNDFNAYFFLQIFHLIFEETDLIYSIIQTKLLDISYCKDRVNKLLETFQTYRTEEQFFNNIFERSVNTVGPPTKRRRTILENDLQLHCRRLYNQIFDMITNQISNRFKDFEQLHFFNLMNNDKFLTFKQQFPHNLLKKLLDNYPQFFNNDKLENELRVLYSDPGILGDSVEIREKLKFITDNSLQEDIPEIFKLISLILTIPATSASVERSFSVLKRIKSFTRNTIDQSRLNNLGQISIEKELLKSLRKTDTFFDQVIDHFAEAKDRRIDLIYKKL